MHPRVADRIARIWIKKFSVLGSKAADAYAASLLSEEEDLEQVRTIVKSLWEKGKRG